MAAGWGVFAMANERARQLRKSMTRQEVKLWVHLRSWRSRGFHFRRQAPRDPYIVDFVCLRGGVVVEVDGGQHNFDDHQERDRARDAYFAAKGLKVLGYWNNEIDRNLEGVLMDIDRVLAERGWPPPTRRRADARRHPPPAGEG
jgi:very-short-patch-repair endonuclease